MQTIHNIYNHLILLTIAVIVCTSCQQEADEWTLAREKSVTLEFSVSQTDLTRVTPTNTEKSINSLRVYAFNGNKQAGYIFLEATAPDTPFYMDLELPEHGLHEVNFYLIANETEMVNQNSSITFTAEMTPTELEAICFTGLHTGTSLPMYAKQTAEIDVDAITSMSNTATEHEGHFLLTQKIIFKLERPIAKLSVYAAKSTGTESNPKIHKVELLSSGTRLYNFLYPKADEVLHNIPSRANNRELLGTTVTINKEVTKGTEEAISTASYNEVVLGQYLSEVPYGATAWNNPSDNELAAVLRVEYALGEGMEIKNAYIHLPRLQRNHHIKVCILINAEGQMIVNYNVADWDDYAMPDYSFDYPTHSYLRASIPSSQEETVAKPTIEAQMRENMPFKGYFQMTLPGNDAWTPTLLGLNGSNCEIRVFEGDTNTEIKTESFPIPASNKWYRIEVWPLEGGKMPVEEEVNLAISYTATGLTESEFLLINGSSQEYYWPYYGTSEQDANYVIITMEN